ncbi:hypothetical protein CMK14_08570 [Candidatus Poribacteria bacterium]|nr:hypothetical protein [Candidatus Poribacteria bacterium]
MPDVDRFPMILAAEDLDTKFLDRPRPSPKNPQMVSAVRAEFSFKTTFRAITHPLIYPKLQAGFA